MNNCTCLLTPCLPPRYDDNFILFFHCCSITGYLKFRGDELQHDLLASALSALAEKICQVHSIRNRQNFFFGRVAQNYRASATTNSLQARLEHTRLVHSSRSASLAEAYAGHVCANSSRFMQDRPCWWHCEEAVVRSVFGPPDIGAQTEAVWFPCEPGSSCTYVCGLDGKDMYRKVSYSLC